MKREYEDYLRDMLENAEKALFFVQGIDYDGFYKDDKAVYAVIRALEIIGEAARQIPEDVRQSNSEIQWREIAAMFRRTQVILYPRSGSKRKTPSSRLGVLCYLRVLPV